MRGADARLADPWRNDAIHAWPVPDRVARGQAGHEAGIHPASARLFAGAGGVLHVLDLFRRGRHGSGQRLGLSGHLSGPDADVPGVFRHHPADRRCHPAREDFLAVGLSLCPLWQEPRNCRGRDARRRRGQPALHRPAAEIRGHELSGAGLWCRWRHQQPGQRDRAAHRCGAGHLRHPVRHAPVRCDTA